MQGSVSPALVQLPRFVADEPGNLISGESLIQAGPDDLVSPGLTGIGGCCLPELARDLNLFILLEGALKQLVDPRGEFVRGFVIGRSPGMACGAVLCPRARFQPGRDGDDPSRQADYVAEKAQRGDLPK